MIDVKEAKEANEATAQVRKELREKVQKNTAYGMCMADTFRDPAEMVTISADRFEKLVRVTERLNHELGEYEEKIRRAYEFIDVVAQEWAEKGKPIPQFEDMFRMSAILGWSEPREIRLTRERVFSEKEAAKREKEAANNGEATD